MLLYLDYMHARYHSPHLGRFLSFDPLGGDDANPQSWNRYAYGLGNPLKYTDPSGLIVASVLEEAVRFCIVHSGCSNEVIDVVAQDPGFNPLTGVQGLQDLMGGSSFMLGLSGAIGSGSGDGFTLSFSERVLSSIPSGVAQTTGDAVVGFGDTLSFGLTDLYRTEVGLANTINEDSGAFLTGQVAGVAHGVALGGAGGFRASASTRLFGRNTFLNTGGRLRIGHSGHKGETFFSIRGRFVDRLAGKPKAHIDLWRINRPR